MQAMDNRSANAGGAELIAALRAALNEWAAAREAPRPSVYDYRGMRWTDHETAAFTEGQRRHDADCQLLDQEEEATSARVRKAGTALAARLRAAGSSPVPIFRFLHLMDSPEGAPDRGSEAWADLLAALDEAEMVLGAGEPGADARPARAETASVGLAADAEEVPSNGLTLAEVARVLTQIEQDGKRWSTGAVRRRIERDKEGLFAELRLLRFPGLHGNRVRFRGSGTWALLERYAGTARHKLLASLRTLREIKRVKDLRAGFEAEPR